MNPTVSQVDSEPKLSLEAEPKLKLAIERAARIAAEKGQQLEPAELFAAFVEYAEDLLDYEIQPIVKRGAGKEEVERVGVSVSEGIIERIGYQRSMDRTRPEGKFPQSVHTTWDENTGQTVGYDPKTNQAMPMDPMTSWAFAKHGDFERFSPGSIGVILRADGTGKRRLRLLLSTALHQRLTYWKGHAIEPGTARHHGMNLNTLLLNRGLSRNHFYQLVAEKASCNERTVERAVSGVTKQPGSAIKKAMAEVLNIEVDALPL